MSFKKRYTESMVMTVIDEHDNITSVRQITNCLGCSKETTLNLLKSMLKSNQVKRVNVGTDAKPTWIYSRSD